MSLKGGRKNFFKILFVISEKSSQLVSEGKNLTNLENRIRHYDFADAAKDTPFYKEIIPAMLDYFETEHYVFTHGWIPSIPNRDKSYSYISSWREAGREQWNQARWFNGMDAAQTADENKTIVCGHWHTSYGHSKYEHKGTEFGEDADFSPYYGPGIIAIDACTAFSGKVNCLVIED